MKKTITRIAFAVLISSFARLSAQTNPAAVALPFSMNSVTTITPPAGVAVHRFSAIQISRTLLPANGDLPNQGSSAASATGGWYNLGTDGIGLLSSGTNPAGAVIVAINTTGFTNISVSWLCKTIKNQASRDNSIALQYRVGTSGNFTDVGNTTTYSSAGMADGHSSSTLSETLPAGANNQAVVQVRWIYWESVSTSGSRDKISVDDISISGATTITCAAPAGLSATGITTVSASLSWGSVAGAASYQYSVSTSATPPALGTGTTGTTVSATGLTSGTVYYLHVRSFCGDGSFSGWATISFTTLAEETGETEFVVMTYNLLNYPGSTGSGREPAYRTIVNDVQPDIMVVQELSSALGIGNFLGNVLNFSTPLYSQGAFIDGPDSDNGIYYKSTKFQFISNTAIQTNLRNINRFKLKYIPSGDTLFIFSAHLKASNTSPDEAQRADEVDSLRKVTNAMAAGKYFMVCGDFNIYSASESAYQKLTGNGSNANGKFNDVLSMPGTWNNSSYAIHHTQSPRTTAFGGGATGGLDDRFDMFLFSDAIVQAGGIDVVSGTYKAYGNDGAHYNQALNTPPYTMYSSAIASALHDASDHLPVVVKLKYSSASPRPTGIAAEAAVMENSITIYPNPSHASFSVKASVVLKEPVQFELYDINGRSLQHVILNGSETMVDVSHLQPGMYYLRSAQLHAAYKILVD